MNSDAHSRRKFNLVLLRLRDLCIFGLKCKILPGALPKFQAEFEVRKKYLLRSRIFSPSQNSVGEKIRGQKIFHCFWARCLRTTA